MKWLQFILSHSLFISVCAAALCYQSFIVLQLPIDHALTALVFFATLCSYNFYWLLSKFYFSQRNRPLRFLRANFSNLLFFLPSAAGVIACIVLRPAVLTHISVAVVLTLFYSVPLWPVKQLAFTRKAGFLKTVVLAFTWAYVTVMIPSVQGEVPVDFILIHLIARFLFMLILCIIFDSRDIEVDKIHALRSLATDVSRRTLGWIVAGSFTVYLICGFVLRFHFYDRRQIIAFLLSGLFSIYVYRLSLKKQNYFFYYFLVDGLMLFSALASFLATI